MYPLLACTLSLHTLCSPKNSRTRRMSVACRPAVDWPTESRKARSSSEETLRRVASLAASSRHTPRQRAGAPFARWSASRHSEKPLPSKSPSEPLSHELTRASPPSTTATRSTSPSLASLSRSRCRLVAARAPRLSRAGGEERGRPRARCRAWERLLPPGRGCGLGICCCCCDRRPQSPSLCSRWSDSLNEDTS